MSGTRGHLMAAGSSTDSHAVPISELCARLCTSINVEHPEQSTGLTDALAAEAIKSTGANAMRTHKRPSGLVVYAGFLLSLFNALMIVAGAMSMALYAIAPRDPTNMYLGAVLVGVAIVNATIDWVQHYRTAVMLESFMDLVPHDADVLRSGAAKTIPATDLVPGDVVCLQPGSRVPADVRVFASSNDLRVDNSSITGESEPVQRWAVNDPRDDGVRTVDAACMLFSGTIVVTGEAYGVVVATGDATVLGGIAGMAVGEETPPSQLGVEIALFVRRVAAVAVLTAAVLGAGALARGITVPEAFSFVIGLVVAFVPQGLPVTVSLLLTAAARRMARRNVLVKNLHAVETLGALTLLATDKTGTLTQNRMTVVAAWLGGRVHETGHVHDDPKAPETYFPGRGPHDVEDPADSGGKADSFANVRGALLPSIDPGRRVTIAGDPTGQGAEADFPQSGRSALADAAVMCCVLCTHARLDPSEDGAPFETRRIIGDATETGLLRFGARHLRPGESVQGVWARHPRLHEVPFSSATKWHMVVVGTGPAALSPAGAQPAAVAYIKGAPERVARMCSGILVPAPATKDGALDAPSLLTDALGSGVAGRGRTGRTDTGAVVRPWGEDTQRDFESAYAHFAGRGQRVLALAMRPLDTLPAPSPGASPTEAVPTDGFFLIGLVALMDPPKRGVRRAVAACRQAGVQIVMVTGDHTVTAEAIARQVGIIRGATRADAARRLQRAHVAEDEYDAVVVHGEHLGALSDAEWDAILAKDEVVFARTTPAQKLEVVTRMQTKGHIVGVTGDGVNDSPALKKADLGVSMNRSASDVSKAAAAMILLDDDFGSVAAGIAEGRLIFANLQKSVRYTITHLVPEVVPFALAVTLGLPLPLNPMLVLAFDLGSELGPALSFAAEPPEADLMLLPPRKVLVRAEPKPRPAPTSLARACVHRAHAVFAALFMSGHTGDSLVSREALFWVFVQGGVIVAAGCISAYLATLALHGIRLGTIANTAGTFWRPDAPPMLLADNSVLDAAGQMRVLGCAQSAYYAGIVIGQLGTLWVTKRRYAQPFGAHMLRNPWTFVGALTAAAYCAVVVYVPWINTVLLAGGPVPVLALLPPLGAAIFMVAYESVRRALLRRGWFGGVPRPNRNILDLVRSTTSMAR